MSTINGRKGVFMFLLPEGKVQKRVLNDYLYNLYEKYRAENATIKISRSLFYKLRPKHLQTTNFSSCSTCLCQRHQNMALQLRAIKATGIDMNVSPDSFLKNKSDETIEDICGKLPQMIKFGQWKRVDVEGKKKMQIVEEELDKDKFADMWRKSVKEFESHAERVKVQYEQMHYLKKHLPADHAIIQMDFAENYTCQHAQEVQSAHWNAPSMVTLHPTVVYYSDVDGELTHQSIVYVSSVLEHNSTTVYAFLRKLIPEVKTLLPNLKHIHYFTDSPTSQYRNKSIFYVVTKHDEEFGVSASWNYFEAGHGKGPCDGIGGTAKRMADEAVRQEKLKIDDAEDFFAWAEKYQSNSSISYRFVPPDDCAEAKNDITTFGDLQPVPGTMKLHAVVSNGLGVVYVRDTSCVCQSCFHLGEFNFESDCGWRKHLLKLFTSGAHNQITPSVDDWVAAVYDAKWYLGKVLGVDAEDNTVEVTFLEAAATKADNQFKWPQNPDVLWIPSRNVLAVIQPPVSCGRSQRVLSIDETSVEMIENLFQAFEDGSVASREV